VRLLGHQRVDGRVDEACVLGCLIGARVRAHTVVIESALATARRRRRWWWWWWWWWRGCASVLGARIAWHRLDRARVCATPVTHDTGVATGATRIDPTRVDRLPRKRARIAHGLRTGRFGTTIDKRARTFFLCFQYGTRETPAREPRGKKGDNEHAPRHGALP
jgi:hypothetical protein